MATIADVARLAGVSRSTVSYALSGKRSISGETRRRIEESISILGFIPNAGARALATSQTMVLGLLLQFHEDEFAPAMLEYMLPIADTARDYGYDILMVTDREGPRALERITRSGMVDGVVLLDVTYDDPRLPILRKATQPGVVVGLPAETEGLEVIDLDFAEAARRIVDHLWRLGHREVILVSPPEHVFDRGAAYSWRFRDAAIARAAELGIGLFPFQGESRQPGISASLSSFLDARPGASALVVHNDATVAALPAILGERGVRVPEDLSVVSLYAKNFGNLFSLPYTAVETSPDRLGHLAVELLVHRILDRGGASGRGVRFLDPVLRDRGSTRCLDPAVPGPSGPAE